MYPAAEFLIAQQYFGMGCADVQHTGIEVVHTAVCIPVAFTEVDLFAHFPAGGTIGQLCKFGAFDPAQRRKTVFAGYGNGGGFGYFLRGQLRNARKQKRECQKCKQQEFHSV